MAAVPEALVVGGNDPPRMLTGESSLIEALMLELTLLGNVGGVAETDDWAWPPTGSPHYKKPRGLIAKLN